MHRRMLDQKRVQESTHKINRAQTRQNNRRKRRRSGSNFVQFAIKVSHVYLSQLPKWMFLASAGQFAHQAAKDI